MLTGWATMPWPWFVLDWLVHADLLRCGLALHTHTIAMFAFQSMVAIGLLFVLARLTPIVPTTGAEGGRRRPKGGPVHRGKQGGV